MLVKYCTTSATVHPEASGTGGGAGVVSGGLAELVDDLPVLHYHMTKIHISIGSYCIFNK